MGWKNTEQAIDSFFNNYSAVFNRALKTEMPDIDETAELFSSCFIAASPLGVNCGQNNETFREAMQNGYTFYKNIGITSMDIVSKNIAVLDNFHAMTKIRWKSNFKKKDGSISYIEFENIYFTHFGDARLKVFAYITGDEQTALKDAGLI